MRSAALFHARAGNGPKRFLSLEIFDKLQVPAAMMQQCHVET
jgi:hypothetical protein